VPARRCDASRFPLGGTRYYIKQETGGSEMGNETEENNSVQQYALAYGLHYESENLKEAFEQYRHILLEFPDSREAGYARSQIQHIVNATVPREKILESQMKLATAAFDQISKQN
jgi:hypothetical protein